MIGVVPVLAEQLADDYLKNRFEQYLEDKIQRARRDAERFQAEPGRRRVSEYWLDRFQGHYHAYRNDFYRDILGTLKWLQDEGIVEVLTSAATHGFLPLMERDSAVFAQVRLGVETYRKYFGRNPRGFWLPECAYRPAQWSHQEKRRRKGSMIGWRQRGLNIFLWKMSASSGLNLSKNSMEKPLRPHPTVIDCRRASRYLAGMRPRAGKCGLLTWAIPRTLVTSNSTEKTPSRDCITGG